MLTPQDIQNIQLIDTEEIAKRLRCGAERVGWYRKAGLLKYRKLGKHYLTTEAEYAEFINLTSGMDLSNKLKIRLAGMQIKKRSLSRNQRLSDIRNMSLPFYHRKGRT